MLKYGDFYKEYKVKVFSNEAQEGLPKKCGFFQKPNSCKNSGAKINVHFFQAKGLAKAL